MLKVIQRATSWPVTRAEAMTQCNLMDDDADQADLDHLDRLIKAASKTVGDAAGLTLQPTTFEQLVDCWPSGRHICLETGPVREVEAVSYLDRDGVEQLVDGEDWFLIETAEGGDLYFQPSFAWPALADRPQSVRIRFVAGFDEPEGSEGETLEAFETPEQARQAVLLLVGDWFAHRETAVVGEVSSEIKLAASFDRLIEQIRVYR